MRVIVPQTAAELDAHYRCRYETLRKPWGKPPGSERDANEDDNLLASALDANGHTLGVARLLPLEEAGKGQVRSMGVLETARGQGVGKHLLRFLETKAAEMGMRHLILHARKNAVPFYQAAGYEILRESYVLWDIIPHYEMEKWLKMRNE